MSVVVQSLSNCPSFCRYFLKVPIFAQFDQSYDSSPDGKEQGKQSTQDGSQGSDAVPSTAPSPSLTPSDSLARIAPLANQLHILLSTMWQTPVHVAENHTQQAFASSLSSSPAVPPTSKDLSAGTSSVGGSNSLHRPSHPIQISPRALYNTIGSLAPQFGQQVQCDSEELLGFLLNRLDEELAGLEMQEEGADVIDALVQKMEELGSSHTISTSSRQLNAGLLRPTDQMEVFLDNTFPKQHPIDVFCPAPSSGDTTLSQFINTDKPFINFTPVLLPHPLPPNPARILLPQPAKPRTPSRSIITRLFQGQTITTFHCSHCGSSSPRHDVFFELLLPIASPTSPAKTPSIADSRLTTEISPDETKPNPDGTDADRPAEQITLYDCLSAHFKQEKLTDGEKHVCDNCGKSGNGHLQTGLSKLPEVLCVTFKRLSHFMKQTKRNVVQPNCTAGIKSKKITTFVSYPLELDMSRYMPGLPKTNTIFRLFSVVVHKGDHEGGHYVCYSFNRKAKRWFYFDDHRADEVDDSELDVVLKQQAYTLFYQHYTPDIEERRANTKQLQKYFSPPSPHKPGLFEDNLPYLVSAEWYSFFKTIPNPGPLNNYGLFCEHHRPTPPTKQMVTISSQLFRAILATFGGGPVVTAPARMCPACLTNLLKDNEFRSIVALERKCITNYEASLRETSTLDMSLPKDIRFVAIDAAWLDKWRKYVRRNTAYESPGPISNQNIATPSGQFNQSSIPEKDYRVIPLPVYQALHALYGGGPQLSVALS
ncbi:putative Ubiquitin carboxyl-terminal hydrolase 20 [Blattamonas nauphoetae]|uniref:Ubiquitin carboxyl-terminal hydrolase 20 n=1 Tax=Blattamonas nauphoetae TaxID=2049346 RepID=A0ABQ9YKX6_9EUKA|nr:putative Ubiquitin carboxyl-terminal hydrolase 20 [Blattamonas nauphoetae]